MHADVCIVGSCRINHWYRLIKCLNQTIKQYEDFCSVALILARIWPALASKSSPDWSSAMVNLMPQIDDLSESLPMLWAYGCIPVRWVAKHPERAEVERHHVEVYSESIWIGQLNRINLNILFVSSAKNYEISVCNKIRYRKSSQQCFGSFRVSCSFTFCPKITAPPFLPGFFWNPDAAAELHQKHPLLKEVLPPLLQEKPLPASYTCGYISYKWP